MKKLWRKFVSQCQGSLYLIRRQRNVENALNVFDILSLGFIYKLYQILHFPLNHQIVSSRSRILNIDLSDWEKRNFFTCMNIETTNGQDQAIVYSRTYNQKLLNLDCIHLEVNKSPKYPENRGSEKFFYLNLNNSGTNFFNSDLLCLVNDIDIFVEGKVPIAYCHKGTYFDHFMTNRICELAIRHKETDELDPDGIVYFPKTEGSSSKLKSISESKLCNTIGISIIAMTRDNFVFVRKQNMKSQSSPDLIVPSGSGSCDWEDYANNKEENFVSVIRKAMVRELFEENSHCPMKSKKQFENTVNNTLILGYFRWLPRGGLPEFVGFTKLDMNFHDIAPNSEELFTSNKSDNSEESQIHSIDQLGNWIENLKISKSGRLSVPLQATLLALQDAIKEYPCKFERLISPSVTEPVASIKFN